MEATAIFVFYCLTVPVASLGIFPSLDPRPLTGTATVLADTHLFLRNRYPRILWPSAFLRHARLGRGPQGWLEWAHGGGSSCTASWEESFCKMLRMESLGDFPPSSAALSRVMRFSHGRGYLALCGQSLSRDVHSGLKVLGHGHLRQKSTVKDVMAAQGFDSNCSSLLRKQASHARKLGDLPQTAMQVPQA